MTDPRARYERETGESPYVLFKQGDVSYETNELKPQYVAWLEAQVPVEDEVKVDAAFVRSLGKTIRDDKDCVITQVKDDAAYLAVQVLWESNWQRKRWRCIVRIYSGGIDHAGLVECATRSHVLDLLRALGVQVKGESK